MAADPKDQPPTAIDAEDVVELDGDDVGSLEDALREALAAVEEREEPSREAEAPAADAEPSLEALVVELKEKWLRALADLENYRKRTQRERQEELRYRGFEIFRDLVPILDNLDRALASEGSLADWKQGVDLTRRQLDGLLRGHGVERIDALGRPFDPSVHEAVSHQPDPAVSEPTVAEELQPGYRLRDRLLRPVAVRVAMPIAPGAGPEDRA